MSDTPLFSNDSVWVVKEGKVNIFPPKVTIRSVHGAIVITDWGHTSKTLLHRNYKKQEPVMAEKQAGGARFNTGKSVLSMVLEAKHAMDGCAKVLMFGAKKYSRGNWHKGLSHTEIVDSMLRHQAAYLSGEDIDPESGLRHVDHIMCNAMFLAESTIVHPNLDDRSDTLVQRELDKVGRKTAERTMRVPPGNPKANINPHVNPAAPSVDTILAAQETKDC